MIAFARLSLRHWRRMEPRAELSGRPRSRKLNAGGRKTPVSTSFFSPLEASTTTISYSYVLRSYSSQSSQGSRAQPITTTTRVSHQHYYSISIHNGLDLSIDFPCRHSQTWIANPHPSRTTPGATCRALCSSVCRSAICHRSNGIVDATSSHAGSDLCHLVKE